MPKLRQIREDSFLTQEELAEKIGCAEHTVSNGNYPLTVGKFCAIV